MNVRTNFDDYGLAQPVGLLRADLHHLPFRRGLVEVLDAIVCDPPYGVRGWLNAALQGLGRRRWRTEAVPGRALNFERRGPHPAQSPGGPPSLTSALRRTALRRPSKPPCPARRAAQVRAGGRKAAPRDYVPRNRDTHIAATDPYPLGECLRDLLDLAARMLRVGAWVPGNMGSAWLA